MKDYTKEREYFTQGFKEFVKNNINLELKYYGVSLAPICIYDNPESLNDGKACIALGRERDGIYEGKFNFFGGKLENKYGQSKEEEIANTLFDETLEEMGIILTPKTFEKSVLGVITPQIYDGYTIIFVSHIIGLSNEMWQNVMKKRYEITNLEWKYQEMSEIDIIAIEDIQINYDSISKFVRQNFYDIIPFYNTLSRSNITLINLFKTT